MFEGAILARHAVLTLALVAIFATDSRSQTPGPSTGACPWRTVTDADGKEVGRMCTKLISHDAKTNDATIGVWAENNDKNRDCYFVGKVSLPPNERPWHIKVRVTRDSAQREIESKPVFARQVPTDAVLKEPKAVECKS
ncbi:MAG: hypothetical protein ABL886_09435 [Rhodoglobus sp.]